MNRLPGGLSVNDHGLYKRWGGFIFRKQMLPGLSLDPLVKQNASQHSFGYYSPLFYPLTFYSVNYRVKYLEIVPNWLFNWYFILFYDQCIKGLHIYKRRLFQENIRGDPPML